MKLTTIKTIDKVDKFGFIGSSIDVKNRSAKVSHSVKQTYKGAKIARVQNLTDIIQVNAIDNKIKWAKHKEQRKLERKQRQESI